jgi:hypothetical protein
MYVKEEGEEKKTGYGSFTMRLKYMILAQCNEISRLFY